MTLTLEQRLLLEQAKQYGPVAELTFAPGRRFRIDVAIESHKLAIEIEGGGWVNGRHSRGLGIESDSEKSALLAIHGWRLIRCTPKQVRSGVVLAWIHMAIKGAACL